MAVRNYNLEPANELRIEVEGRKEFVELTLLQGKAEIFGTELVLGKSYTFLSGANVAVFTWHGCSLKLKGNTEGTYIAKETPMAMYLNTHTCLERLCQIADEGLAKGEQRRGPVTMIVGPTDVGKSTLCRILVNYAVRMGRRPLYVDLDVGQGAIAVPGTIGTVLVEQTASVEEGFSQEAPLVYNFGNITPSSNMTLYNVLVSRMAQAVQEKIASNRRVASSGVFINTCGWVKGAGYHSLIHIAQSFRADIIIVLDQERLYNEFKRDIPFIRTLFLPKSGGVVKRTQEMRISSRDERICQYFYGINSKFHPYSFDVKINSVNIYKVGAPALPNSCLPANMKIDDHMTKLVKVFANSKIKHYVLAVTLTKEPEDLPATNVAGFICVLDVDENAGTMKVLSPHPKPLPDTLLLFTEVQYMDSN